MGSIKETLILAGNSNCVQRQTPLLSFLKKAFSKVWWIWLIITVPLLLWALFKEDGNLSKSMFYFCISDIFLVLCNIIWNKNGMRCPFCHHFFCTKRISEKKVVQRSSTNTSRKVYDNHSGILMDNKGNIGMYRGTSSRREYGKSISDTLLHNVRCSHCGAVSTVKQYDFRKEY